MEEATPFLDNRLPLDLIILLSEYEWTSRKFHKSLVLDDYTIYQKFIINRQLEKPKKRIEDRENMVMYSVIWTKLIKN